MSTVPTVLPPWYAASFAAPPQASDGEPHVWAFRPWIGEWKRIAVRPPPVADQPHFNRAEAGADRAGLAPELEALAGEVTPLLAALHAPSPVPAAGRAALARFMALVGVRNAPHAAELEPDQVRQGAEAVEKALAEMGWVLWAAPAGVHVISGSCPFHMAFPRADQSQSTPFDVTDRAVEITFPLSPRVALHATWQRTGELWRTARKEVLHELNARVCASSRRFLIAPKPQVPG